jgi:hypothetical protein
MKKHGKEMYRAFLEKKEVADQAQALENRIKRLKLEHERTNKKIEETRKR